MTTYTKHSPSDEMSKRYNEIQTANCNLLSQLLKQNSISNPDPENTKQLKTLVCKLIKNYYNGGK